MYNTALFAIPLCVYACTYGCIFVYACTWVHAWSCILHACILLCTIQLYSMYTFLCVYLHIHTCVCALHAYPCAFVSMCICMSMHIFACQYSPVFHVLNDWVILPDTLTRWPQKDVGVNSVYKSSNIYDISRPHRVNVTVIVYNWLTHTQPQGHHSCFVYFFFR